MIFEVGNTVNLFANYNGVVEAVVGTLLTIRWFHNNNVVDIDAEYVTLVS